jgi:hypothetical protein
MLLVTQARIPALLWLWEQLKIRRLVLADTHILNLMLLAVRGVDDQKALRMQLRRCWTHVLLEYVALDDSLAHRALCELTGPLEHCDCNLEFPLKHDTCPRICIPCCVATGLAMDRGHLTKWITAWDMCSRFNTWSSNLKWRMRKKQGTTSQLRQQYR